MTLDTDQRRAREPQAMSAHAGLLTQGGRVWAHHSPLAAPMLRKRGIPALGAARGTRAAR